MTEEYHRTWDVATKVIAPILTAIGLFIGVVQFGNEQRNIREREFQLLARNDALDFKRRVWERQVGIYMNTARVVGEIAVVADRPDKLREAVDRFDMLYWGNMILVEDPNARENMIRFHVEVQDYRKGISSAQRLKIRAAYLVDSLRASSHASWTQLSAAEIPPSRSSSPRPDIVNLQLTREHDPHRPR